MMALRLKNRKLESKILSPQSLRSVFQKVQRRGTKTVFTNGCFDILHSGHVQYLQKAKSLGHFLVVALNTDRSVRALKGKNRPVNPLRDRLQVIAALECVDYVTWFNETTPLKLIERLQPQVLVKGGDWKINQIVGASFVLKRGGQVRSLPFLKGRSTTEIIHRVKSSRGVR